MNTMPDSILVVSVNPVKGRELSYDDWYTHMLIRDAMRIEGGIAVQRFIFSDDQVKIGNQSSTCQHQSHTIYEWESTEKAVRGHFDLVGTPAMVHTRDCHYGDEVGGYFRCVYLSNTWSRDGGFPCGPDILTAMIVSDPKDSKAFTSWFRDKHAPATVALPGFESAALFEVHEASKVQSLPADFPYTFYALYSLSDRRVALDGWSARQAARDPLDISTRVSRAEVFCWEPRTARILREWVMNPSPEMAAEERRARLVQKDREIGRQEMEELLRK